MVKPTTLAIKLKGSSILITVVQIYVDKNIKKRISLIIEVWEVYKKKTFNSRAHDFHEYLQVDLNTEEGFYKKKKITIWDKSLKHDIIENQRRGFSFSKSN